MCFYGPNILSLFPRGTTHGKNVYVGLGKNVTENRQTENRETNNRGQFIAGPIVVLYVLFKR